MIGAQDLDWEDIKSFAIVAAAGSVRRGAKQLGVHHSTLSRRIDSLEQALGTRLFDRRPEGYVLTTAGEELASVGRDIGSRLNDAERHISGQDLNLSGVVTVTMAEAIATHVFAPRLAQFANAHPNIELRILATTALLDLSRREADIAIRVDNNPPESLVGKRLFAYTHTVYAAPDYLAMHDFQAAPDKARWIGWRANEARFPEWTKETEFGNVPVWGYFPDPALQQAAARNGLGLVMLPCFLGDRDPLLVRASKRKPLKARDVWLLTHSDLRRTARIKAFMSFAEALMREAKPDFLGHLGDGSIA